MKPCPSFIFSSCSSFTWCLLEKWSSGKLLATPVHSLSSGYPLAGGTLIRAWKWKSVTLRRSHVRSLCHMVRIGGGQTSFGMGVAARLTPVVEMAGSERGQPLEGVAQARRPARSGLGRG